MTSKSLTKPSTTFATIPTKPPKPPTITSSYKYPKRYPKNAPNSQNPQLSNPISNSISNSIPNIKIPNIHNTFLNTLYYPKKPKTRSWSLPSLPKTPFNFDFSTKLQNMKNVLFKNPLFTKVEPKTNQKTMDSDLQSLNSQTVKRKTPPPSYRKQRYIPYFTILPKHEYLRQSEMYRRPIRRRYVGLNS